MRLLFSALLLALHPAAALQETWQTGYSGEDASGPHVLGYWTFDGDSPLADNSSHSHHLTLNGATLAANGKRGGALQGGLGFPVSDSPHQARAAASPRLSPSGPFTIDLWLRPDAGFEKGLRCHLLDKKYTNDNHSDYSLLLLDADKSGLRRVQLNLGFGTRSASFNSDPVRLPVGEWSHLAVTYDAAGTASFYLNGSTLSSHSQPGLGATAPGKRPLTLADRNGSNFSGFPGLLDEVRLCNGVLKFEPVELVLTARRSAFRRMEKAVPVQIECVNLRREPVTGATLRVEWGPHSEVFPLPALQPGKPHTQSYHPATNLKPGPYALQATLDTGATSISARASLHIAARPLPDRMPVVMWGSPGQDIARLKDIGFTHFIGFSTPVGGLWASEGQAAPGDPAYIERNLRILDDALAAGLNVVATAPPAHFFDNKPDYLRVGRDGKPFERLTLHASHPDLPPFFEKVGRSIASTYGRHPAFTTVLINTEVRDGSRPSFNPRDIENYRAHSGRDIPPEVDLRSGVDYHKLPDFPADRVVPDDHPILDYYRWFWTVGDGWNALHSALHRGVKASGRRDLWTFFDPAVRQPSISGAGGQVDVLSHWTYTYPDPQRIGLAADQLLAMSKASGRGQKIMKMTQLIWYRSQTAPLTNKPPENPVPWEDHDPDAAYITIAPMHLKAALWTKLSRPVQGVMYHGWQSLVPVEGSTSSYRHTNPNTVHVLRDMIRDVVEPLGPSLLKLAEPRREVAFLESFTSQVFSRRGGHGYNNTWSADLWHALQHAHLQSEILYEETLLKNGLSGVKLLVMPECEVLSESVASTIRQWQEAGGKILADELLCPAIKADFTVNSFRRVKNAAQDKAAILEKAREVRAAADQAGLSPSVTSDNPEVILRTRQSGEATCLFAINDHREPGTYVGQHGLVMENGLPSRATLTLATDSGHVYDLLQHRQIIPGRDSAGRLTLPVELGPCEGRLFLISPKPLLSLHLDGPAEVKRGAPAAIALEVRTTGDQPAPAVIPVRLRVTDANGVESEGSGHYAAEKGRLSVTLEPAPNDAPGSWQIEATELASGMTTTRWLKVTP
jgi:hypothetical protein